MGRAKYYTLSFTEAEYRQLVSVVGEGYADGDHKEAYCFTPQDKAALERVMRKLEKVQLNGKVKEQGEG